MNSVKEIYILYKNFLKRYRSYYNIFFLADLMHWMGDQTFLNAGEIKEEWKNHLQSIKNKGINEALNFYIHIPFCESRCAYCMYYSKPAINKELEDYLDRLIQQMRFFKETFFGLEFSSLYLGGGTPSILTTKQINKLFSNLFNCFEFKEGGERTFECNPKSITLGKLKLLKEFGFNRVSFGVQNLDKKVLTYANRDYQSYDLVKKVVENAKSLGLEVNADLMVGIKGDNVKSVINSFIKLVKIKPQTITLYSFKPSEECLKKYFNNDYYLFNSRLYKKAEKVWQILESMEDTLNYYRIDRRGFEIYSTQDPTFIQKKLKRPIIYDYDYSSPISYQKPCSLFALGTRASSYIFKSLQYHDAAIGEETNNFSPKEKIYWAMEFNLKDEMRYYILQQLSGRLCFSQKEFERFFNSDFKINFKDAIESLKKLGKIKFDGDLVFLPPDPLERFTCSLFFFDKKEVSKKINDFFQR